ncbi:MAG: hypothetical protein U0Y10_02150 [Spirosomataceae bacterium]
MEEAVTPGTDGFTSSLQTPSRSNATTAMSGIYSVTVGGSGNCTGTATTSVVINASPVATASSNSPVCSGSNTLNLNASGGSSYMKPSGFSSTIQSPSRTNATTAMSGVYSVTVSSTASCSDTETVSVVINPAYSDSQ